MATERDQVTSPPAVGPAERGRAGATSRQRAALGASERSSERITVLYLGGWGRSGSTLLDRLLGQLPGVTSLGEVRELWLRGPVENRLCGCGAPFRSCPWWREVGDRAFGGWDRDTAAGLHALRTRIDRPWHLPALALPRLSRTHRDRLDVYADALRRVYAAVRAMGAARVVVDSSKLPGGAMVLRRVPGVDLRLVHLVRDSRGVAHSWQKKVARPDATREHDEMLRYGPVSASIRYGLYNSWTEMLQLFDVPFLQIRYEDLVADPRGQLTAVAAHAGVDVPSAALDFLTADAASFGTAHTVDGNPMRFHTGRVAIRRDDGWRSGLAERDRRIVSSITGPWLRRYGYLR